jgi:UDP-glucose 4-epimerase
MGAESILTGSTGFIGKNLFKSLCCDVFNDDIRYFDTEKRYHYVFHFGSPSSQVLFKRNTSYCIDTTINGFLRVVSYCKRTGAKLIYPSTGHISYNNEYAKCKSLCESIAQNSGIESLGIRIFAGYGPGEEHKRDFKSPVGLFLDDIIHDRQPIIYGDGNQRRDFVYIDDIAENIIEMAETRVGIAEIGTGVSHSFNEVVEIINKVTGKNIKPIYADKPQNYVEETLCKNPIKTPTSLEEGIEKYYENPN